MGSGRGMLLRRQMLFLMGAARLRAAAAAAPPMSAIASLGGLAASVSSQAQAEALPQRTLRFPRDHGAHPELRTEWWYLTGQLQAGPRRFGFQVTFFRSRVEVAQALSSAFAARQLLFAHAALTDVAAGRLLHDQRIARAGFGIAEAAVEDTRLRLQDWSMRREGSGRYATQVESGDFGFALQATPTQPLLLQGREGLSRKGPQPAQASYYYSQPQLAIDGRLRLQGREMPVTGRAWLDHEWSQEVMHPQAVGWDWAGINLTDGAALTVFRLRRADGSTLWAGGSWRPPGGAVRSFEAHEVRMTPGRIWRSPHTSAQYPVQWVIETPAGRFGIRAEVDAQELDSRRSTGTVYWEGLSVLEDAGGRAVGHGYLEMTGYHAPLRL